MNEDEVIIVDTIPEDEYLALVEESVKYAIISLPFTIDRMRIPNEKQRALNIAKGKLSEELFKFFCINNNIDVDFETCTTPFWTIDKKDFLLDGFEWDIKNNFIYHAGDILTEYNYSDLPALIPNRHAGDQWSKRNSSELSNSNGSRYLFTFIKNTDLINGERGEEFLKIVLSSEQHSFLRSLYEQYNGLPQQSAPFTEDWFWEEFESYGNDTKFEITFKPSLIITGYAGVENWNSFLDTGPYDRNYNLQTYLERGWYQRYRSGAISFLNKTLWTKITNKTCPISSLNSFLSEFPHLLNEINYGRRSNR